MAIEKGQRVRLKQDHRDEQCLFFTAGQTGTAAIISPAFPGKIIVNFDGYEAQRKRQEELIQRKGEGFNLVRWVGVIPEELLEVVIE